jgi:uracil-DNA glycosylase family 4
VIADPALPIAAVDDMDWLELGTTVGGCTACRLCLGRKAPVFAAEPATRQADWLVVGEPPDELEERAGVPFAGQSGRLLDNMLRAVQVARDGRGSAGARVTNVVKCRSAPVRNPQVDELAACAAYLRREIALVRPKVILAMGRFAALSLLAESNPELASLPFGKLRGQVYRYCGVPVVVTYHPSRLLRAQEDKAGAWADLCLAQGIAHTGLPQDAGPT